MRIYCMLIRRVGDDSVLTSSSLCSCNENHNRYRILKPSGVSAPTVIITLFLVFGVAGYSDGNSNILGPFFIYPSFAQQIECANCINIPPDQISVYTELFPLTIWTDADTYDHDSVITLSGHLRPENAVHPVTITVLNPIGNIVTIEQIYPESTDGFFTTALHTSSDLWSMDGIYVIKAQSGAETRLFNTQVEIISYDFGDVSNCTDFQAEIKSDNRGVYCVDYYNVGENIFVDGFLSLPTKTLSLNVRTTDVGELTLHIPRYLIDAQTPDGAQADFEVFWNDQPIVATEDTTTADHLEFRTITIPYTPDRQGRVDIIGTTVVPEFGSIVMLVTVLAMFVAILLSARRLGLPQIYRT